MSPASQIHAKISGPIVMIGFGSIGKGTLPLIERHFDYDKSRFVIIDPHEDGERAQEARRALHQAGRDHGQLSRIAGAAAHRRRRPGLLRQPLGRHLLGRHHGRCAARSARSISTPSSSRGSASISTRTSGPEARSNYALRETLLAAKQQEPRAARPRSPPAAPIPAWCRGSSSRRCSTSPRDTKLDVQRAEEPANGLGPARAQARRQGHPYRRARHPALQEAEADGRVRQHLVGGRLRVRRHAAGRTRLGHP